MTFGADPKAAGVRVGQVLASKYRVERVLGVGGMGVVVAAHHLQLDEKVAIKFLLPETLQHAELVARFAREARAAAKIKSEHVARVIDVGTLESGAPYTVMEFLDGMDLAARIRKQGALPIELAVDLVLQASEALAEAHALGIVHRDLKPGNLFVTRRPDGQIVIKVLDFGISKLTGNVATTGAAMTRSFGPMGSPLYMSPEQMQAASSVDVRTDIWALGVVLYEAVAGVPPFPGDTLPEVCAKILTLSPKPLPSVRPGVPPGLDAVVQRCLEKDREKRFPNVAEMATPLAPFGSENARMSLRRISGVLMGSAQADAPAEPTLQAPHLSRVGTLAAPPEPFRTPPAVPPAAPQLLGTGGPVASTMPAPVAHSAPAPGGRSSRALVWIGAGVLGIAGAVAAWTRGGAPAPLTASSAAAMHAPSEAANPASSAPLVASAAAPGPLSPSAAPPVEASPAAASASNALAPAAVAGRSTGTAASTQPRAHPRAETAPKAATSVTPAASLSSAPPAAPPLPVLTPSAATAHCRLVSSFDARGREHFTQVCDGN